MRLLSFVLLMFTSIVFSQVGVATTSPQAMLDINGDLRIQTVNVGPISEAETSVLIVDGTDSNIVKKVSSEKILTSFLKSFVKVNLQSTSDLDIVLLDNSSTKIDFDDEEFDLNDEYDVTTNEFTPKQDGYYEISSTINIKPDGALGITTSTDVSLQVHKNSTVIAESSGPLVGATVGLVNVYLLPIRTVSTLVYLTTTDTVSFHIQNATGPLGGIDIDLQSNENGFFYIKQVR